MRTVLIIDDEEVMRALLRATLDASNYQVLEAEDGELGVQLARSHLPDLILCDIAMPKLDGFRTLEALRLDPATAMIPIILMTGMPDNAGMRQGMVLGADDYLPKPFTMEELLAAVGARFKKHQIIQQQAERKLDVLRSNISLALPHELYTPLSGITGLAQILEQDSASLSPSDVKEIGASIQASAKRLLRLIKNFLIYAQIELLAVDPAKVEALRPSEPIPLDEVVKNCALQAAQRAGRQDDLCLEVQSGHVQVKEEYLKKIAEELLENAFKFSAPGAPVRVRTQHTPQTLTLVISDRGRGMTPADISNVGAYMQFERKIYEQQGSGMGLAVAKRLAELHGGELSIQSVPDLGTTVTISLPGCLLSTP